MERFNGTVLDEFFRGAMREKFYGDVASMQADLDAGYTITTASARIWATATRAADPGTRSVSPSAKKLKRLSYYISPEARVPPTHPLRRVRALVREF